MSELEAHTWPGNVRELRNVVEATLVMGTLGLPSSVESAPREVNVTTEASFVYKEERRRVLDRFEKVFLSSLLATTGGNVRQAARVAQMDRSYLMKLIKDHGVP